MLIAPLNASEVDKRIVAIVRFGPPMPGDGLRPAEYYQVTVDPERFSPCGDFVRFGSYPGDELLGWQNAKQLYVVSTIAEWPAEFEQPILPWSNSPALLSKL